jgi:hypothetical protein
LQCNGATFKVPADFRGVKCGANGLFQPAELEDGEGSDSRPVSFEKSADFRRASFGSQLVCDRARFKDQADFRFLKCGDHGFFNLANFEGEGGSANFTGATFGGTLQCNGATFKGPAYFHGVKCGANGLFQPAELEDGEGSDSRPVSFEQSADFGFASFGENLECNKSAFKGLANFAAVKCGANAIFSSAEFGGKDEVTTFERVSIGGSLVCNGATFKGSADFRGVRCGMDGLFQPAELEGEEGSGSRSVSFEKSADFGFASFARNLECNRVTFKERADFRFLKCGYNAIFTLANFEAARESADFTRALVGENLECYGAAFRGPANFSGVKCGADGLFSPAEFESGKGSRSRPVTFEKDADFRFASFAQNLECNKATFKGSTSFVGLTCGDYAYCSFAEFGGAGKVTTFERASIEGALVCEGTAFQGTVIFYNAKLGILILKDTFQFAQGMLDLRELTFKRFDGTPEQAEQFAKAQDPTLFSRNPYLQLEEYYRSIGRDAQARDIYCKGRLAYRENAGNEYGSVEWFWGTNVIDWLWKELTRYGIQVRRLLLIAISMVILGTLFFLSDNTLKLASDSANSTSWEQGWLYRAAYSLDLFLPLVNLHIDEKWTPNGPLLQAYSVFHAMVGWLIVPLLIAALAGIIRR